MWRGFKIAFSLPGHKNRKGPPYSRSRMGLKEVERIWQAGTWPVLHSPHFFLRLHPVVSVTNSVWGCLQSQQYSFTNVLLLFHTHYMFRRPIGA
jgi:hypothetical protein